MNYQRGSYGLVRLQEGGRVSLLVCGILSAAVFLAASVFTLTISANTGQSIFRVPPSELSEGWTDGDGNAVTLPAKLSHPQGGAYILRAVVPEQDMLTRNISLLYSAKYLNVTLFLDDREIGSCLGRPEDIHKLNGKSFLIAELPADAAGKELRIEAVPLLGTDMKYEINAPLLGTGESLVTDLINSDLPMLVILEGIFCFGLLLMLLSWQARGAGSTTFFQMGLFAILFAMYSLSITDTIHLFLDNARFIYLMEFLLLALFPLPLLMLLYHVCLPKFRPALLADINVLTINFSLQTALYFWAGLELRDMVWVTHLILGLSVLLLIPILVQGGRQGRERFRLIISFVPMLLGAAGDIVRFYLPGTYQKAVGFQLGVLFFVCLQTFYLVCSYLESDLYRKAAYTDALTGLENRTAFEERIVQLGKDAANYTSVWCVCADINCLKRVNDTLGHSAGDELIRGAAKVLQEVKSKDSNLYRTGGDEFVLFEFNRSEESMEQWHTRLEAALRRYNQAHGEPLSIALGYDRLYGGDTITKLISRADSLMYKDKHRKKAQRNNIT